MRSPASALGAPDAAHVTRVDAARDCGDIGGEGATPHDIDAEGVRCRRARQVADRVGKVPSFGGCAKVKGNRVTISPCTRSGFHCREFDHSRYTSTIRCSKGRARIRFDI
jgi:hypothetical protein